MQYRNELVVLKLFDQPLPTELPTSCMTDVQHFLQQIDDDDNDIIFEHNITPYGDKESLKRIFLISHMLLKPAGAIQQSV